MGTVVTGAVVVVIVGLIIRSMVRDKKNGKSFQRLWEVRRALSLI